MLSTFLSRFTTDAVKATSDLLQLINANLLIYYQNLILYEGRNTPL